MPTTLDDAIARIIADAKAHNRLVRAAPAADRLAQEFGGNAREIAEAIIQRAIEASANIHIAKPDAPRRDPR